MHSNKNELKQKILLELKKIAQQEIKQAKDAFETSHQHATDNELKAESKYDTRGVEAGYLAGAQKKRLEELEMELALLEEINLNLNSNSVSVGSLLEIEFNKIKRLYFVSAASGGPMIQVDSHTVLVISAFSPIGAGAIGLEAGDNFEVEAGDQVREYTILQIW